LRSRTDRLRTRPRGSTPASIAASSAANGRGAGGCGWSNAAARRIWPLQKSSSAEDMAAAEGDGKRDEKSKSKSMPPPTPVPAREGLAGAL
jgi:hypothetical protein